MDWSFRYPQDRNYYLLKVREISMLEFGTDHVVHLEHLETYLAISVDKHSATLCAALHEVNFKPKAS